MASVSPAPDDSREGTSHCSPERTDIADREMGSTDQIDMMTRLDERRAMEISQELNRIEQMNKVSQTLRLRRIARNILTKVKYGPLGQHSNLYSPLPERSGGVTTDSSSNEETSQQRRRGWAANRKEDQREELESIRRMKLVQAGVADRNSRSRARRMFNHRVYINNPRRRKSVSHRINHKSTSVLVTQSGDVPDESEVIQQESQCVIENFYRIPSHHQRVLQRLTSEDHHNKEGEDSEVTRRPPPRRSDSILEVAENHEDKVEKETRKKRRSSVHGGYQESGSEDRHHGKEKLRHSFQKLKEKWSTLTHHREGKSKKRGSGWKWTKPLANRVVVDGSDSESDDTELPLSMSSPKETAATFLSSSHTSSGSENVFENGTISHTLLESPLSPPTDPTPTSITLHDVIIETSLIASPVGEEHQLETPTHQYNMEEDIIINGHMMIEDDHLDSTQQENGRSQQVVTPTPQEEGKSQQEGTPTHQDDDDDGLYGSLVAFGLVQVERDSRPQGDEDEVDHGLPEPHTSSGLTVPSDTSTAAVSPSQYKRHFSSPQLSLSDSIDNHHIPTLLPRQTPHGYYTPMDVEIDPFKIEFEKGLKQHRVETDHCSEALPKEGAAVSAPTIDEATPKKIPAHAFKNPRFCEYIKNLGREPRVQDYVSFKLCIIGDQIDRKYDTELNHALDAVFFDIVKNNITWEGFSTVSKRLLFEGQRVQDGIFMVTCFGRRVFEAVPHLRDTINNYTQQVIERYAADIILTVGGWNNLMESYSQVEVYHEDEIPQEVWPLPDNVAPYDFMYETPVASLVDCPVIVPRGVNMPLLEPAQPVKKRVPLSSPISHSSPLRRAYSVEVLFDEPCSEDDNENNDVFLNPVLRKHSSHSSQLSLTRSLSDSSLAGTPATVNLVGSSSMFQYSRTRYDYSSTASDRSSPMKHNIITIETVDEEEVYFSQHSRQTSISSVASIRIVTGNRMLDDGPVIVSRGGPHNHHNLRVPGDSESSGEELPDIFASPMPSRSSTINHLREGQHRRKKNSSSSGNKMAVVAPVAGVVALVGAVLLGYWYFSRKK